MDILISQTRWTLKQKPSTPEFEMRAQAKLFDPFADHEVGHELQRMSRQFDA